MIQEQFEKTTVISESPVGCVRYISWSSIIVAALVAVGLMFLLNVLTTGLGLTAFTFNTQGQLSLMIGGFVWLLIASYFIMFLVGWIAGNLVQPHRCLGVLHGFAAWSLALIIIAALFSQSATSALGTPNNYSLTPVTAHNAQVVTTTTTTQEAAKANLREATGSATTTEAVNKVGIGVLGIFFISLAGALGSCTGGYVGSDARYATRRERHL